MVNFVCHCMAKAAHTSTLTLNRKRNSFEVKMPHLALMGGERLLLEVELIA